MKLPGKDQQELNQDQQECNDSNGKSSENYRCSKAKMDI